MVNFRKVKDGFVASFSGSCTVDEIQELHGKLKDKVLKDQKPLTAINLAKVEEADLCFLQLLISTAKSSPQRPVVLKGTANPALQSFLKYLDGDFNTYFQIAES